MGSIQVVEYEAGRKSAWDDFVARSKNGTFLFQRDYVEYHADRFPDNSLMFYDDRGNLIALLPATLNDGVFSSHAGLTFGGIVSDTSMRVAPMLDVFEAALDHLQKRDVAKVIYKAVPHIYHQFPAEEDLYALFRYGARLFRRDVSSTIEMKQRPPVTRRRNAAKLRAKFGIEVKRSFDFQTSMAISAHVLETKYDTKPVHTHTEIALLADRFPDNIKLFAAYQEQEMLAGAILYESSQVAHAQYIGISDEGKRISALDLIVDYLINDYYVDKKYFDFGISTEDNGRRLNTGLIENKQSFGGRAVVHDFYELTLTKSRMALKDR
jgi:hypothetical protein